MEIFKQLELDVWYKIPIYIGGVLLILSLFQQALIFTNLQLILLSLSLIFCGLGEWKNAYEEISYRAPNAYTGPAAYVKIPVRIATPLGTFFWLLAGLNLGAFLALFL